jgi:hypothetical protein
MSQDARAGQAFGDEATIFLHNILRDEVYTPKALSLLKSEYLRDRLARAVFEVVAWHTEKYGVAPNAEAIALDLANKKPHTSVRLTDEEFEQVKQSLLLMQSTEPVTHDPQWLLDETEKFCRFEAMNNAIFKAVDMMEAKKDLSSIPGMLEDASPWASMTRRTSTSSTEVSSTSLLPTTCSTVFFRGNSSTPSPRTPAEERPRCA